MTPLLRALESYGHRLASQPTEPAPEGYSGKPPCLPVWKGERPRRAPLRARLLFRTETRGRPPEDGSTGIPSSPPSQASSRRSEKPICTMRSCHGQAGAGPPRRPDHEGVRVRHIDAPSSRHPHQGAMHGQEAAQRQRCAEDRHVRAVAEAVGRAARPARPHGHQGRLRAGPVWLVLGDPQRQGRALLHDDHEARRGRVRDHDHRGHRHAGQDARAAACLDPARRRPVRLLLAGVHRLVEGAARREPRSDA